MHSNKEIAQLLKNVAAALIIKGANRFRIIAYENAASSIMQLTSQVKDLWKEGKLKEIMGVGPTISGHLEELFITGKVKHFEETFKGISPAVFTLLLVPGIGPKRADQLTKEFKLNNEKTAVGDLEKIARQGKIAKLAGWGAKSEADVLAGIETYKKGQIKENRMLLPFADALAQEVVTYLKLLKEVKQVDLLGSLRRKVTTIGDIDMAVSTEFPEKVVTHFVNYPKVRKIIDQGPKGATVLLSVGRQVDLRVQTPNQYGAMLQYFTGNKQHNIKLRELALRMGLSLNEHGIKMLRKNQKASPPRRDPANPLKLMRVGKIKNQNYNSKLKIYEFAKEEEFYRALGMDWIPPEIREDTGEIEAALRQAQSKLPGLPNLVELKNIKGDVHIHSNYDLKSSHDSGSSTLGELLTSAAVYGYDYLGISDHNPKTKDLSQKKIIDIMKRRKSFLEQQYYSWTNNTQNKNLRTQNIVKMFIMLETDITPSGELALPDKAFEYVDAVIVSVHSALNLDKQKMTERLLRGLSHPKAKILGHPTGRLIGKREGSDADWERIFNFCLKHDIAIEINSWPERLDLPDKLVREAIRIGVKLIINTDSHNAEHLQLMRYGVDVARRGWAEKKDILNTLGYNEFKEWLIS